MLGPDLFVPIAEQTGLIRPLSRWVLDAALRQCNRWRQDGLDLGVAVNLSMRNLHDPEIADMIRQLLARWSVPAQCLTIEITESSLMADAARAMEVLTGLRAMGVSISIDDFGTGYSSLAYLKRLPVHELKIDKSFVAHMASDDSDAAIVRSTIGLAHDLGLSVVAEGVEDQQTWDLLAALGCDVAQGYYISRPLPALVLGEWLETGWHPRSERAA
jgi:EAL domain-containing protein (putative c-di-GMP-specific phosphodiesterase class I)